MVWSEAVTHSWLVCVVPQMGIGTGKQFHCDAEGWPPTLQLQYQYFDEVRLSRSGQDSFRLSYSLSLSLFWLHLITAQQQLTDRRSEYNQGGKWPTKQVLQKL